MYNFNSAKEYVEKIKEHVLLNELDIAIDVYKEGIRHYPQFLDLYIQNAELSMKNKDYYNAIEAWNIIRSKFPQNIPDNVV